MKPDRSAVPATLILLAGLAAAACTTAPAPAPIVAPEPEETLAASIERELTQSPFDHAIWGIHIEEENGDVLYSKNAATLMIPASNRKIFTAALNQSCFSLTSTIPTELWIEGEVSGGILAGNVILKGYGDPSFVGRYDDGSRDERLAPFLRALRERGIGRVLGSVLGDATEFDRRVFHGTWQFEDLGTSYQTPIDALAFNENVVGAFYRMPDCGEAFVWTDPAFVGGTARLECGDREVVVYSSDENNDVSLLGIVVAPIAETEVELISIRDAALYAAQGVQDFLVRGGIDVDYAARAGVASRSSEQIATIESPPLAELLTTMMKASQNLYADTLFKRIAAGGIDPARWEDALAMERLFLTEEVGIDPTEFSFADGSGLSVRNLVTPRAIVTLLRWLSRPERRGANEIIFAVPSEAEGTLRRRLQGLESVVRGKTGTLTGVNALSGWVRNGEGRLRYFAIVVNHHDGGSSRTEAIIDSIVRRIGSF